MARVMRITLYADYAPCPLWGPRGLIGEEELPLSEGVKDRIRAWLNAYGQSPRGDWPLWEAPEGTADEEEAWVAEGAALRDLIPAELGPEYHVVFEA